MSRLFLAQDRFFYLARKNAADDIISVESAPLETREQTINPILKTTIAVITEALATLDVLPGRDTRALEQEVNTMERIKRKATPGAPVQLAALKKAPDDRGNE